MGLFALQFINMKLLTLLSQGAELVTLAVSREVPLHPLHTAQPHNSPSYIHNYAHASSPTYLLPNEGGPFGARGWSGSITLPV